MARLTDEQVSLGWYNVDLSQKHFVCMGKVANQDPVPFSIHKSLTSALEQNGNIKRDWRAEGFEVDDLRFGVHQMVVGGSRLTLFVDHVDQSVDIGLEVNSAKISYKPGKKGRSEWLIEKVQEIANR